MVRTLRELSYGGCVTGDLYGPADLAHRNMITILRVAIVTVLAMAKCIYE